LLKIRARERSNDITNGFVSSDTHNSNGYWNKDFNHNDDITFYYPYVIRSDTKSPLSGLDGEHLELWLHNIPQSGSPAMKVGQGSFKISRFLADTLPLNQTLCYKNVEGKYVFEILQRKDSSIDFLDMKKGLVE